MSIVTVQTDSFFSIAISKITTDGKVSYLARDIGLALGYANGGAKLARNIARRWTADFTRGVDFDSIKGEDLDRLRGLIPRLHRARRPMVLYAGGIAKVLARAPFEIANPLSAFLRGDTEAPAPANTAETFTWIADGSEAIARERDHFHGLALCALTALRMGLPDIARTALEEGLEGGAS